MTGSVQQRFALEVSGGGSQWRFEPGRTGLIGREATADILLSDIHVSRRHAEIRDTGTGWVIVDVGSRHGLWWNSQRVPQVEVHGPTTIRLGGAGGLELRMTPVPASGAGTGGPGSDSGGQFAGSTPGGSPGGQPPGGQTPGGQPPGGQPPAGPPPPGGPPGSGPGAPTPPAYGSPQQPVMPPAAS